MAAARIARCDGLFPGLQVETERARVRAKPKVPGRDLYSRRYPAASEMGMLGGRDEDEDEDGGAG